MPADAPHVGTRVESLRALVDQGASAIDEQRPPSRRPTGPLGWIGSAVAALPELEARARTADEIGWSARAAASVFLYAPLLDGVLAAIADAAVKLAEALAAHLGRDPLSDQALVDDVEEYAALLFAAHRTAPRRSEFLVGGYVSFVAGAIETAGALADARLEAAQGAGSTAVVEGHSASLTSTLANALGGLLAYAELIAADRERLTATALR